MGDEPVVSPPPTVDAPAVEPAAPAGPALRTDIDYGGAAGSPNDIMNFVSQVNDFDDLPETVEEVVMSPEAAPASVPAQAQPQTAPQQPVVERTPTVPVQPQAPVQPQQAQQPQVVQQPQHAVDPAVQQQAGDPAAQPAEVPYVDPFQAAADSLRQHEAQFTDALAKQMYQISEEDFQQVLNGNPEKLSMLCARIHVNSVKSVMQTVAQQLPIHVDAMLAVRQRGTDREAQFWANNPNLDRTAVAHLVPSIARTVRQMNPQIKDPATIDRMVGQLVATAAGFALQGQAPVVAQQPSQPQVRTPGKVVRQVQPAFSPGGVNNGGQTANGGAYDDNVWSRFATIVQAEQSGALDQNG